MDTNPSNIPPITHLDLEAHAKKWADKIPHNLSKEECERVFAEMEIERRKIKDRLAVLSSRALYYGQFYHAYNMQEYYSNKAKEYYEESLKEK